MCQVVLPGRPSQQSLRRYGAPQPGDPGCVDRSDADAPCSSESDKLVAMTGIYAIVNQVTGRRYIGRSAHCERRWTEHRTALNARAHCNEELQREWIEFEAISFKFEILEHCDSHEQCITREQWYLVNSVGLYNASSITGSGPKPGYTHRPESIEKMRQAQVGKPKSDAHRANISAARRGQSSPKHDAALRGKTASAETRRKMSAAHKRRHAERPFSIETCAKLSAALTGRVITWGDKISAAKAGKKQSPAIIAARMAGMKAARERRRAQGK